MSKRQIEINYWTNFYNSYNLIEKQSDFCVFIMNYFKNNDNMKILDAGCGNGRDSYYLSTKHNVIGLDTSSFKPNDNKNCIFIIDDFCSYNKDIFDLIYSRFTFHSIDNNQQELFIKSINKKNTLLCIETRSEKDNNDYRYHGDNHYRNLTNKIYLENLLLTNNFIILFSEENNGFSIYKDEDPICIRIICKKL